MGSKLAFINASKFTIQYGILQYFNMTNSFSMRLLTHVIAIDSSLPAACGVHYA